MFWMDGCLGGGGVTCLLYHCSCPMVHFPSGTVCPNTVQLGGFSHEQPLEAT